MARAVRIAWLVLLAGFLAPTAAMQASRPAVCSYAPLAAASETRRQAAHALEEDTRKSPFFQELATRFGPPKTCVLAPDDESLSLSFEFPNQASLTIRTTPAIEYMRQSVSLPATSGITAGITAKQAVALLKLAEKASFGAEGCRIAWNRAPEKSDGDDPGTRVASYRGDACNCQGQIVYRGKAIVGLILSSAC